LAEVVAVSAKPLKSLAARFSLKRLPVILISTKVVPVSVVVLMQTAAYTSKVAL